MDEKTKHDRRIAAHPVALDRRQDMNTRVSILEVITENNRQTMDDHAETTTKIIDRLDTHIQQSAARDQHLQNTIGQITVAVTQLSTTVAETNTTLKDIAKMAGESHTELIRWNTIIATLIKVATVGAVIIGGAWTLFTFIEKQHHDKVALVDIPAHIIKDVTTSE